MIQYVWMGRTTVSEMWSWWKVIQHYLLSEIAQSVPSLVVWRKINYAILQYCHHSIVIADSCILRSAYKQTKRPKLHPRDRITLLSYYLLYHIYFDISSGIHDKKWRLRLIKLSAMEWQTGPTQTLLKIIKCMCTRYTHIRLFKGLVIEKFSFACHVSRPELWATSVWRQSSEFG